jgi:IS5 family transposase
MPTLRGLLTASPSGIGSKASWPSMACDDTRRRQRLKARGIEARILDQARRNKPLTTWQKYFNKTAAVVRAAVERPFALMKGPYAFARCHYLGLERNGTHLQLFASAYNLKTAVVLVR